jgi:hypothetical protein
MRKQLKTSLQEGDMSTYSPAVPIHTNRFSAETSNLMCMKMAAECFKFRLLSNVFGGPLQRLRKTYFNKSSVDLFSLFFRHFTYHFTSQIVPLLNAPLVFDSKLL